MGISRVEALDSFASNDLIGIGMEADAVRRGLHPEGVVCYALQCSVGCAGEPAAVSARAAELLDVGGSGIRLVGGGQLQLDDFVGLIAELRRTFPEVWIEGLSAGEAQALAQSSGGSVPEVLKRLQGSGLDTFADDGPDLGGANGGSREWLDVHQAAHRLGMRTVASMRFGGGESVEDRLEFLDSVRELQAETGGFSAVALESAALGLQGPTAVEGLKMLAISRLMLDTVEHVQAGSVQGLKVLETALRFGANDAGAVEVTRVADLREEDLRRVIRDAGFAPVERDMGYRMVFAG